MRKIIELFIITLIGATVSSAQDSKAIFYQSLAWSPDGRLLAVTAFSDYDARTDEYRTGIFVMNADGSRARKISGDAKHAFSPAWSADGRRVFFGADGPDEKESNIFSVRSDGRGLIQLTKNAGQTSAPAVSPDGRFIAFMSRRGGEKYQIYVRRADGSGEKKLTDERDVSFCNPVWSKDGRRIVFYTDTGDRKDQIWIMNADGSNRKRLTDGSGHNIFPSFAGREGRIVFSRRDDKDSEKSYTDASFLYTMKTDGSDLKKLSDINSFYARFSPDGKLIAYVAGKFPSNAIYIARADGSNVRKLTE